MNTIIKEKENQLKKFGKFKLIEKIGAGGMAEIYKAVIESDVPEFTKVVALKKILPAYSKNAYFIEMFINEAKLSASLQHSNIVQIYEVGQFDGQYYIVMEYVHGKDLLKLMGRMNKIDKKIPEEICLYIVKEIAKALAFAHSAKDPYGKSLNIIHRDLSPSNVLISFEGNVKIMDFGIAKASLSSEKGKAGILKGKIGYMSPEQVLGKEVTHQSDIFSLGIILFEILTLKRLFLGRTDLETLINIREADLEKRLKTHPEINDDVKNILRKAVVKKTENRFKTADEFNNSIENYLFLNSIKVSEKNLSALMKEIFTEEAEQEILPLSESPTTGEVMVDVISRKVEEEDRERVRGDFEEEIVMPTRPEGIRLHTSSFKIKDSEGIIFGPVSFSNVLSLIKSRVITERDLCSINEGEWFQLGEITSIKEYFPPPSVDNKQKILIEGKIFKKSFLNILYDLCIKKSLSGVLIVKHRSIEKEVYFKKGKPRYIYSTSKNELFGEFLVKIGRVTKEQLDRALAISRDSGSKLGDTLIKTNFIKHHELANLLGQQFMERFFHIFTLEDAWFGFFENVRFPENIIPMEVDLPSTLSEAVRKMYSLKELLNYFGDFTSRIIEKVQNKYIDLSHFKLSSRELRVYSLIDQFNTIDSLMKKFGRGEENDKLVYNVLFLLLSTEFIKFRGESKFSLK